MRILCLGASYTGRYLARNFPDHEVLFLSRDPAGLRERGYRAFAIDPETEPTTEATTARFDLILDTLPAVADANGSKPGPHPYRATIDELLAAHPATRVLHVSSTSVYSTDPLTFATGETLRYDETVPANPGEERGAIRLRLEQQLRGFWPELLVVRAAGIYGPGRSLALRFQAGDFRRAGSGNKIVSRIHVHDLCRLILAQAIQSEPQAILNAVDTRPTANAEVFGWLEERLNITIPGDWRGGEPTGRGIASLYAAALLGGRYRFPTYREGFEHSLAADA